MELDTDFTEKYPKGNEREIDGSGTKHAPYCICLMR